MKYYIHIRQGTKYWRHTNKRTRNREKNLWKGIRSDLRRKGLGVLTHRWHIKRK